MSLHVRRQRTHELMASDRCIRDVVVEHLIYRKFVQRVLCLGRQYSFRLFDLSMHLLTAGRCVVFGFALRLARLSIFIGTLYIGRLSKRAVRTPA